MLALADQGGARQDDAQHGDIIDQLHHAAEPGAGQVGIEFHPHGELYRQLGIGPVAADEFVDLAADDILDIAVTDEGLAHAGGIDVDLDLRLPAGQHVPLKIRRISITNVYCPESIPGSMAATVIRSGVLK